jgi:Holliday junction DNA helicase RuvA
MIASVRGQVLVRRPDHVVVESGGVGYRLAVSAETLKAVPARGKQVSLHSHLVVRDDAMHLYGFASEEERDLFLSLISVSQVGPKVAIAILSGGTPRELLRAIAAGDAKRFQAAPGVGKRTAERIIVELREKVAGELEEGIAAAAGEGDAEDDPRRLAREGLMHLGYTLTEADKLLDGVDGDSPELLINAALRRAGQREAA